MMSKKNQLRHLICLWFLVSSVFSCSYAQQKVCFFKYAAYPEGKNGGKLSFGSPDEKVYTTKMDYSKPGQIVFVYGYGSKIETTETYKRVTNDMFDEEPKEIRGHKLLGVYFNTNLAMYDLYYLSPDRASMLHKTFVRPGKLFSYRYFSDTRANPFVDLVLPCYLNDTIQLKAQPQPKKKAGA
jgi:hypothetical protein